VWHALADALDVHGSAAAAASGNGDASLAAVVDAVTLYSGHLYVGDNMAIKRYYDDMTSAANAALMQDMAAAVADKPPVVQPKQQQQPPPPPPPPPQKQLQRTFEDKSKDPKDHKDQPRFAPRADAPWCFRFPHEKIKSFCPNHGPGTPLSKPHPGSSCATVFTWWASEAAMGKRKPGEGQCFDDVNKRT